MRKALLVVTLLAALVPASAGAAGWRGAPVTPSLDGKVGETVRAIAADGRSKGNQAAVFAKIGDSISESGSFLQDMACVRPRFGRYARLASTWRFYRQETFPSSYTSVYCGVADSFSRASAAAVSGWTTTDLLRPPPDPPPGCADVAAVSCELKLLHPAVALIMIGTNDTSQRSPGAFEKNLERVVAAVRVAGTVPVLSTIPPRTFPPASAGRKVPAFNARIAAVARRNGLPLWNFWRQLTAPGVPNDGLDADGLHPSLTCPPCDSTDFNRAGLKQGYTLRNLGALLVLARLRPLL